MRAVHPYVAMLIVMYCNAMCTKHSHLGLQACCLRALALTVLRVLNSLCLPKTKDDCCSCIIILQCLSAIGIAFVAVVATAVRLVVGTTLVITIAIVASLLL